MKNVRLCVLLLAFTVLQCLDLRGQSTLLDSFAGPYVGLEIGTISYNTQITFDGVNDPAGRGGFGYGMFTGHNFVFKKVVVGGELFFNLVNEPDPYTFDPVITGFSDLELKRSASYGLEVRGGFFLVKKLLIYGSLGYSRNKQTVLIDGVPLDQFVGGSEPESFGRMLAGLGLEIPLNASFTVRLAFERMKGHKLDRTDFGNEAMNPSLQRFDVEPVILQFFVGILYRA